MSKKDSVLVFGIFTSMLVVLLLIAALTTGADTAIHTTAYAAEVAYDSVVSDVDPAEDPPLAILYDDFEDDTMVIDEHELEMLACVIYQEAGADTCTNRCRMRVGDVVLTRVLDPRFPNTLEEVLTQKAQYGLFHWTGIVWPERSKLESERYAVDRAYRIAKRLLSGEHSDLWGRGYIWQAEFSQGTDVVYECGIYFGR